MTITEISSLGNVRKKQLIIVSAISSSMTCAGKASRTVKYNSEIRGVYPIGQGAADKIEKAAALASNIKLRS